MIKIAFWGTPELTTVYLDALASSCMTPAVIVTNPDRPKGRGHELAATAAKVWGETHHVPILQPEKLDDAFYEKLKDLDVDLSVVVAYGSILAQKFIDLPKYKTLNVHYSLLPKYRGASPTEAAILAGEAETGCAIQVMERSLDSGPLIAQINTAIGPDETTTELRARLSCLGAQLLVETVPAYAAGVLVPKPQDESLATHCGKIKKEDGLLNLSGNALENYRKYKAYIEWPRTHFFAERGGKKIRVIVATAHYENETFVIDRVLPEGKKEMSYADFLRGQ